MSNELQEILRSCARKAQGTIIVEKDDDGGFLIMTPDSGIAWKRSSQSVEKFCKAWFKKNLKSDIGIGSIEWRNM